MSIKKIDENDYIQNQVERIIIKFIEEILSENNVKPDDIEVIGIGSPGTVCDGVIYNAVNLHIDKFDIKNAISRYFKAKIYVQNDCKCSAICEKELGSLKQYEDCIFLAIGTGIGGAVFMQDNMLMSKKYPGFEFGHIIVEKNGNICKCGNKGCFETYSSMKKFKIDIINEFNLNKDIHGKEIYTYIKKNKNNIQMKKFIKEYVLNLAIGLINIINIFEPQAISIGGSFAYYEDVLVEELKNELKDKTFNKTIPEIFVAKYKNDAGIIGASMLDKYQIK